MRALQLLGGLIVLQLNKFGVLDSLSYYCVNTNHTRKNPFKPLLNYNYRGILGLKFKKRFQRFIFLRSPKHFNVGKLQTYRIHSRCFLSVHVSKAISFTLSSRKYLFYSATRGVLSCPSSYITHVKVGVTLKFQFSKLR